MTVRFLALALPLSFVACGSPQKTTPADPAPSHDAASASVATLGAHAHIMPMNNHSQDLAKKKPPNGNTLSYYGGPVLSNVKVAVVQWGKAVTIPWTKGDATATDLGNFFAGVTGGSYFSWLQEYNTPTQNIGAGSFVGAFVDAKAPTGSSIDDTVIQSELSARVADGTLPANDPNMLYFVYFPAGIDITMGGSGSCEVFCAYHGTGTDSAGNDLFYGVMPDQGGNCAGGCGDANTQFDNTTSVSSHELVEATTDSAVGKATDLDVAPLAWYNDTNGEIGDICNAQQGTTTDSAGNTWTVQLEWSNFDNACVATSAAPAGSGTSSIQH